MSSSCGGGVPASRSAIASGAVIRAGEGSAEPEGDIETVVTELILADLQTLEKAAPRLAKALPGSRKSPGGV